MKATEQEEIEVELTDKMREFLAKRLKKNIQGLPRRDRRALPQYKFLISVMIKCEAPPTSSPMLFCARECATLGGWLHADVELSTIPPLAKMSTEIQDIVNKALSEWKSNN